MPIFPNNHQEETMMKIEERKITIRELTDGYRNNDEDNDVRGFGGQLNIRPKYQREFVYKPAQRDAVIDTVRKGFPLNIMYWVKNGDGDFEVLDGQQRTISICEYVAGAFSINGQTFHNLTDDQQKQILDYQLTIYVCEGTDSERLDWFRVINTAGDKLTPQELLNATYPGPWLESAKKNFSKSEGPAWRLGHQYLTGEANRSEYLETALRWISNGKGQAYMSEHQHDDNADALWDYFARVIKWVKRLFPNYRSEMKGVEWGILYNRINGAELDPAKLEENVQCLYEDEDVSKKSWIYPYLLLKDIEPNAEKLLSIRAFPDSIKKTVYARQNGLCAKCGKPFKIAEMDADHITPWSQGGHTTIDNCQMLCKSCNRSKGAK
jgi:hypothetical protein